MIEGKPRLRTVSRHWPRTTWKSRRASRTRTRAHAPPGRARGTFDRILGTPPHLHGRRRQPALDRDRRGRASGGRQWRRSFGL